MKFQFKKFQTEKVLSPGISCEQVVTISLPIFVEPSLVVFPYFNDDTSYSWNLTVKYLILIKIIVIKFQIIISDSGYINCKNI